MYSALEYRLQESCFNTHHQPPVMHSAVLKIMAIVVVTLLISNFFYCVDATYRKPPFNGSIFGKRGTSTDYDSATKALSSMCEIASEACQAWFPVQEK